MDPQSGSVNYRSILVTGASGFVGPHLLPALARRWPSVLHATVCRHVSQVPGNAYQWHSLDIADAQQVTALVRSLRPDAVIHLAAQSHVPTSFQNPVHTWRVNLKGTLNLLESLRCYSPNTRLLYVSSSDIYGGAFGAGSPVTENAALQPLNPYAASKAAADLAAYQYAQSENLPIIRARPFNHTGPGQDERFVLSSFANQIARIERGKQPPVIETGNLAAQRDFLDVQDVINAYISILAMPLEQYRGQAYNIAAGQSVAINELLQRLLSLAHDDITIRPDPARQRPTDIPRVAANTQAIQEATGWAPAISIDAMLQRLLDGCRRQQAR